MSTDPPDRRPVAGFPVDLSAPPQIRAADRDRDGVAAVLADGLATGRLNVEEHSRRLDAAFAARTIGELHGLVSDLPARAQPTSRLSARGPARDYGPIGPWASWLVTALICLTVWAATSLAHAEMTAFWPGWVIGPWGAVLLAKTSRWSGCGPAARACPPRRARTARSC